MPKSQFTEAYAAFLAVLVAARREAGVSQVELGRRIGKEQTFISQVERGVRRLDVVEFYVFAKGLGIDPTALFAAVASKMPAKIVI